MATQILVVDDDSELRDLLRDYLVKQGIEVSVLHDAGSLERRLERERPDLIVLDLMIRHPRLVRAGIVQEPTIFSVLPDPAAALAPRRALIEAALPTRGPRGAVADLMRFL